MAIEAKVRYGCRFCGARQESDTVCRRCDETTRRPLVPWLDSLR